MTFLKKTPRVRLDAHAYQQLRLQVLERDGWRCQGCGSMANLEVHHLQFRSRQGQDKEQNLITLCSDCHKLAHQTIRATPIDTISTAVACPCHTSQARHCRR